MSAYTVTVPNKPIIIPQQAIRLTITLIEIHVVINGSTNENLKNPLTDVPAHFKRKSADNLNLLCIYINYLF